MGNRLMFYDEFIFSVFFWEDRLMSYDEFFFQFFYGKKD
jgi:hypothetical protein